MRTWSIPLGSLFGVQLRLHLAFLLLAFMVWSQTISRRHPRLPRASRSAPSSCSPCSFTNSGTPSPPPSSAPACASSSSCPLAAFASTPVAAPSDDAQTDDSRRFLNPRQEIFIALAGPLTSLLIAAFTAIIVAAVAPEIALWQKPFVSSRALVKSIVWINLLLGAINMLPAYPLDFGRILRVQFSRLRGNLDSSRAAVGLSQAIALLVTIFGVFETNSGPCWSASLSFLPPRSKTAPSPSSPSSKASHGRDDAHRIQHPLSRRHPRRRPL